MLQDESCIAGHLGERAAKTADEDEDGAAAAEQEREEEMLPDQATVHDEALAGDPQAAFGVEGEQSALQDSIICPLRMLYCKELLQ